jgi:hypothetical protein
MVRLARELDISDVGLKKACKRYGIPTPTRGYWAQAAVGNAPLKPGLPPAKIDTVALEASQPQLATAGWMALCPLGIESRVNAPRSPARAPLKTSTHWRAGSTPVS